MFAGDINGTAAEDFMTTVHYPTKITAYNDTVIWLETDGYLYSVDLWWIDTQFLIVNKYQDDV